MIVSARTAEAFAYRDGVLICREIQAGSVIMESDCVELIHLLKTRTMNMAAILHVLMQNQRLDRELPAFDIVFVIRQGS